MKTIKTRQSNIELLRIISMLMIIAHHFSVHGGFTFQSSDLSVNHLWIQFIEIGGKLGVNIFVLISGYFLCTQEKIKVGKTVKFCSQVLFYSLLLYAVSLVFNYDAFSLKSLYRAAFPITHGIWWFASTYFVLFLFSPFLNIFLRSLTKKQHKGLLCLMAVCWSVIPTLANLPYQSNNLIWFVFLYCLAAYIRIYKEDFAAKGSKYLVFAFFTFALTFACVVVCDILSAKYTSLSVYTTYLYGMQMIPMLVLAVFIFLGFKNLNIPHIGLINTVSQTTFGIYLLHDHYFSRSFLWQTVFKNAAYQNSEYLIIYSIFAVLAVFAVGAAIDLIRIYALEKRWLKLVDKILYKIKKPQ